MKKFLLFSFMLCSFLSHEAWAQTRTVTGKVTSIEDGSTLPGVNVVLKGTSVGTSTDGNGNYSISVPQAGGRLIFTFIGMTTEEVEIGNRSTIDIQLSPDVTQISEIIVTGYGVQEKRTLTGSVSSIKGDVIENLPMQSLDRAMQGRAAGVQISAASGAPGGALTVRVRGIGSINASNDPLWIVDGVQMGRFGGSTQASSNPLGAINPNDIESIDVLKDAAAGAIYGAQAANGVIIVTTKRGAKGKTAVSVNAQVGTVTSVDLYDMMNGQEWAGIRATAYQNAGLPLTGPTGSYTINGDPNDPDLVNTNWVDALFRTSKLSNYDVTMSGGDEKTQFLFSGSFQKQEGQIIMSDWQRGTGRLNLTHKASDKFTLGANMSLSYTEQFGTIADGNFVNGPFQAAFTAQPTALIYNESGQYAPYPHRAPGSHLFGYNIVQGVNQEFRLGRTLQTVSSANATYEILPGLNLRTFVGVDFSDNRDDNRRPSSIPVFPQGQYLVRNRRTINWNTNTTLNYTKRINEVHSISGILGYEFKEEDRSIVDAARWGFPDPYFTLLSAGSTDRPSAEFLFQSKREGYFGQAKYSYKDKYIADVTLRRDGSSRFGAETRFGTFYAGSLGWRITEESFMSNVGLFDDLKFRVAYGVVGNSEIPDYQNLTQFAQQAQYAGQAGLRPVVLGNDLLTWEESRQFNVGIDYAVLNNRLYGSIEYFHNITGNQLFSVPLTQDSGFGSIQGNAGEVLNAGIEIELGAVIMDAPGGFKWRTSGNFSTLKNELLSLPDGQQRIGNTLIVGESIRFPYLLEFAGVNPATGKAMIYDRNGNPAYAGVIEDAAVRGTYIPTWYGGVTNTFTYKGLTLETFFQFQGGNKAFLGDLYNLYASGSSANNQLRSQLDHWSQPGDMTNIYRPYQGGIIDGFAQNFGNIGSTQFLADASYLRLKQVTLSYNLPGVVLSKVGLNKATVFVQGINLWTLSKFPQGMDPEVVSNNSANGISTFGVFPINRQLTAGVSLGF